MNGLGTDGEVSFHLQLGLGDVSSPIFQTKRWPGPCSWGMAGLTFNSQAA